MSERQFTRKELYQTYGKENVICVFSEDVRTAFIRDGYTAGVYGWNSDVFIGVNHAYSIGYRPCGTHWNSSMKELLDQMKEDGVLVNTSSQVWKNR